MNLLPLLGQTAVWTPVASRNDRGEAAYGAPSTIRCRCAERFHDVIVRTGETVTARSTYLVIEAVGIGDLLDGNEVIAIEGVIPMRAPAPIGYRAHVR